jgi:hypothetical protein
MAGVFGSDPRLSVVSEIQQLFIKIGSIDLNIKFFGEQTDE